MTPTPAQIAAHAAQRALVAASVMAKAKHSTDAKDQRS